MAITIIFFILAAVCNAVMDKTETRIAFNTSVFRNLKGTFWCKERAAGIRPFLKGTKYRPDAWHISKSLMIIFLTAAVISYLPVTPFFFAFIFKTAHHPLLTMLFDFMFLGVVWNVTFNLFYNRVLKAG